MDTTASSAGLDTRVAEWVTLREDAVGLEALVKLYRSFREMGASTASDERIAGGRTQRHLAGPSARREVSDR